MKKTNKNQKATIAKIKAFSVAEAMIALLIGSIALGIAAPIITKQIKSQNSSSTQLEILKKQIKSQNLSSTQLEILQEQINELKNNQPKLEDGAVMFYATSSCPTGWAKLTDFGGYYLRIQNTDETIGSIKEQMVHKHKHVSPFTSYSLGWNDDKVNTRRYGPYKSANVDVIGDANDYPVPPANNAATGPFNLTAGGFFNQFGNEWFNYTSDGMNRFESLMNGNYTITNVLTCPNRDEGDNVCKKTGNQLNTPYLSDMPLVGNENRPNSLVLTACVKGYKTCSMVDNKLSCSK